MSQVRREVRPGGKWFVILSIGLVTLVSGIIACNDSPVKPVAPRDITAAANDNRIPSNPLASVGGGHNAMVDAVLREVSKKKSKKTTQKELCKLVQDAAIEYARSSARNPAEAVSLVRKEDFCAEAASTAKRNSVRLSISDGFDVSWRAHDLLNGIEAAVNSSASASDLQSSLGPINAAAQAELDFEESQIVLSASAVALSSFSYWSANLNEWQGQLGGNPVYSRFAVQADARLTPRFSFWGEVLRVVSADIEGAISGGVMARLAKAAIPEYAMWTGGSKSLIAVIHAVM